MTTMVETLSQTASVREVTMNLLRDLGMTTTRSVCKPPV